jgi:DNA helicase HerA-like ATPase
VGTSDASSLREILASLDAKQQALLLGHAVPMPIVVKTRTYDQDFYDALRAHPATMGSSDGQADPDEEIDDLFY